MNEKLHSTGRWFRRYFSPVTIGVLGVVVYMIFFSETSIRHKIEYQRIIDSLRTEVHVVEDSMLHYKELNSKLSTDPQVMERVVRERHNMKRADEDVFIFVDE